MIKNYLKNTTLDDKIQDSTVLMIAVVFIVKVIFGA